MAFLNISAGKPVLRPAAVLGSSRANAIPDSGRVTSRLEFSFQSDTGVLELRGLDNAVLDELRFLAPESSAWRRCLPVYTGEQAPTDDSYPPVLGNYLIVGERVRFQPRFPFRAGMSYITKLNTTELEKLVGLAVASDAEPVFRFHVRDLQREPTTYIQEVYPTSDELPENVLKLYVHFSGPVSSDEVYRHVRLLRADGHEVTLPFVEVERGLWDPAHTRLTLFFHPGRIKRGVGPNLVMGPVLRRGETYRLVIDRELRDAQGVMLRSGFEKTFHVVAADRVSPAYESWQIQTPPAGSTQPLVVDLQEPMDHALLHRFLSVMHAGESVRGTIEVFDHQTRWVFNPYEPWVPGPHHLLLDPALEDLSGNRLDGVFDAEITAAASDSAHFKLAFRIQ